MRFLVSTIGSRGEAQPVTGLDFAHWSPRDG